MLLVLKYSLTRLFNVVTKSRWPPENLIVIALFITVKLLNQGMRWRQPIEKYKQQTLTVVQQIVSILPINWGDLRNYCGQNQVQWFNFSAIDIIKVEHLVTIPIFSDWQIGSGFMLILPDCVVSRKKTTFARLLIYSTLKDPYLVLHVLSDKLFEEHFNKASAKSF